MARKSQSRVRWNSDEKKALIATARDLLAKDPGLRLMRAIEHAQSALDSARRRTITQISQVPWFASALRSSAAPAKRGRQPAAAAPAAAAGPSPAAKVAVDDIVAGIKQAVAETLATLLARVYEQVGPKMAAAPKRRGRPVGSKKKSAKRAAKSRK